MPTAIAKVPQPIKESQFRVVCAVCGTNDGYSFKDFDTHNLWCAAAKKKRDEAAKKKTARPQGSSAVTHRDGSSYMQ